MAILDLQREDRFGRAALHYAAQADVAMTVTEKPRLWRYAVKGCRLMRPRCSLPIRRRTVLHMLKCSQRLISKDATLDARGVYMKMLFARTVVAAAYTGS